MAADHRSVSWWDGSVSGADVRRRRRNVGSDVNTILRDGVVVPSYDDVVPTTFSSEVPELLERLNEATLALRSSPDVPPDVEELVEGLDDDFRTSAPQQLDVDPYLVNMLFGAGWRALKALRDDNQEVRRNNLRIALEQVRHALRDIATSVPYAADVPAKEVLARLVDDLRVQQAVLAELLQVSPRQLQRWLSEEGPAPAAEDEARLRTVAQIVNQLRHTFTAPGIVAWFEREHPHLGETPIEVLDDPLRHPELVDLARAARTTTA